MKNFCFVVIGYCLKSFLWVYRTPATLFYSIFIEEIMWYACIYELKSYQMKIKFLNENDILNETIEIDQTKQNWPKICGILKLIWACSFES